MEQAGAPSLPFLGKPTTSTSSGLPSLYSTSSKESASLVHHQLSDIRSSIAGRIRLTLPMHVMTVADPVVRRNSPACAECVSDCTKPSCPGPAEITPQCTDQCVVIACHDPAHDQMSCHGSGEDHCDVICDGVADCTDCTGLEDLFRCCTDYHSYFTEPKAYPGDSLHSNFAWDSSLEAFLCACGEQGSDQGIDQSSLSQIDNLDFLPSSGISTPDFPLGFSSSGPSVQQDQSFLHHPMQPPNSQAPVLTCKWGNCLATFSSLNDLVEHVNHQHLHLTPPGSISGGAFQIQDSLMDSSQNSLSCLWGNCNVYQAPDPTQSQFSELQPDAALGILANHLFQDHLGLQNFLALPERPNSPQNNVFMNPSTPSHVPGSPLHSVPEHSASTPPLHECSGTHVCRWKSCEMIFASCDELTAHITEMHIGTGRGHYVCLWEGCTRHGDNGFASKQKICRHLQTHTGHRPFQCKVCSQNFSEAATLQQHMRRHTQEKPYLCDFPGCGKTFAITGALTIHKRTHNGHKPFKCTYCERAFAESSNLSKHLRTHTGVRPYSCNEPGCGKTFARPDQLTRHMGVHRKKRDGGLQAVA